MAPSRAEIAPGELADKITILQIKRERVRDAQKRAHIRAELGGLVAGSARCVRPSDELDDLTGRLRWVNEELWEIEDAIRGCEARQEFDRAFIELAWVADNTTWKSGLTTITPATEFRGTIAKSSWLLNKDIAFIYRAYAT